MLGSWLDQLFEWIETHSSLVIAVTTVGYLAATCVIAWFTWSTRQLYLLERQRSQGSARRFAVQLWQCLLDLATMRKLMEVAKSGEPRLAGRHLASIDAIGAVVNSVRGRMDKLLEEAHLDVSPEAIVKVQVAALLLRDASLALRDVSPESAWTNRHYELHERLRLTEVALRNAYDMLPAAARRTHSGEDLVDRFNAAFQEVPERQKRVPRPDGWPDEWRDT